MNNHLENLEKCSELAKAVAEISEFNQRAYELFSRPLVQAISNEAVADVARAFHPMRSQRWAFSDLNPFMWWLKLAASMVESQRQPTPPDSNLFRNAEKLVSEGIIASFDLYRDLRDATSEALFLSVYGNMYAFQMADKREKDEADTMDREHFLTLLERVISEPDVPEMTIGQIAMVDRIRMVLEAAMPVEAEKQVKHVPRRQTKAAAAPATRIRKKAAAKPAVRKQAKTVAKPATRAKAKPAVKTAVRKQEKAAPKLAARRRMKTAETPAKRAQAKPTAKPAVRKPTKRRAARASA